MKRQAFFSIIANGPNGSKALFVKSIKKGRLLEMNCSRC